MHGFNFHKLLKLKQAAHAMPTNPAPPHPMIRPGSESFPGPILVPDAPPPPPPRNVIYRITSVEGILTPCMYIIEYVNNLNFRINR